MAPSTKWQYLAPDGEQWYSFDYQGDGSQVEIELQVEDAREGQVLLLDSYRERAQLSEDHMAAVATGFRDALDRIAATQGDLNAFVHLDAPVGRIASAAAQRWTSRTPEQPRFVAGALGPTPKTLSIGPTSSSSVRPCFMMKRRRRVATSADR